DARSALLQRRRMGGVCLPREQHRGRGPRMVVPPADLLLVHRRAQHADRRDHPHLSVGRPVPRARRLRGAAMSVDNRLPPPYGTLIDRGRPVQFTFEGESFTGLAGDCIASALAANDVWLLSRSFKYRRPRGVLTMAGQDANTLVQIGAEPDVLADRFAI